jgi:hypothetical protein
MTNLEGSSNSTIKETKISAPPIIHRHTASTTQQNDQQLTTLQNLKRAEIDMGAVSLVHFDHGASSSKTDFDSLSIQLTVFFIISTLAYTAGFIMADFVMSVDSKNTWPLAEGAFGASLWSTVIIGPLLYAFLLFNTTSNRFVSTSSLSSGFSGSTLPKLNKLQTTHSTNKLSNLVPVLRRNNSSTPMMMSERNTERDDSPREIRVTVNVRTEEYDEEEIKL